MDAFITECAEVDPAYSVRLAELYNRYANWSFANSIRPLNSNWFGKELDALGFRRLGVLTSFRQGLRLRDEQKSS